MTQRAMEYDFDAIVVGGGPAGATAATLIAQEGYRVLLLEKEQFPRYQIGESLLPSTIHGICPLLGLADELEKAGFTTKRGGSFRWGKNPDVWTFAFSLSPHMEEPTDFAFQVERQKFDMILLTNAARCGVTVKYCHQAVGVLRVGDRVTGVRYQDGDKNCYQATCRYVIDASGNGSKLRDEVGGHREMSPHFRSIALFGYFAGGKRLPPPNSGNVLSASFDSGWIWYIPLAPDLTSVGVVVRRDCIDRLRGDQRTAYRSLIADCPIVSEFLDGVPPAQRPPYDVLRVRKDYSYHHTKLWSPGMALIGDAALFVDPVISTGVHLATYGALMAARSVNTVLAGTLDESTCFGEFEIRIRREFNAIYNFLKAFYEIHDEQTYFSAAQRASGSNSSARDAFVDLLGGISSGDFRLSQIASDLAEKMEHPHESGDLARMQEMPIVAEALKESMAMISLGSGRNESDGRPLFADGLGVSANGRRWIKSPARNQACC